MDFFFHYGAVYSSIIPNLAFLGPLVVAVVSLVGKIYILFSICRIGFGYRRQDYFFLLLIAGILNDVGYIVHGLSLRPFYVVSSETRTVFLLLTMISLVAEVHLLFLFFKNLSSYSYRSRYLSSQYWIGLVPVTLFFIGYAIYWGIRICFTGDSVPRSMDHLVLGNFKGLYELIIGMVTVLITIYNYKKEKIRLIKNHIFTLGVYFLFPYYVIRVWDSYFITQKANLLHACMFSGLLTYMLYYCLRKLIPMRFLNIQKHVVSNMSARFNFPRDFVNVIGRLGNISKKDEIADITKKFFKRAFGISEENVQLLFKGSVDEKDPRALNIEKTFSPDTRSSELATYASKSKILIRDEVEFTHFYEASNDLDSEFDLGAVVAFLEEIDADIFIPLYSHGQMVASIVVDMGAREEKLFTDVERDEMLIYCDYLGGVIYLLCHVNLDNVLESERAAKLEAYRSKKQSKLLEKCMSSFVDLEKAGGVGVLNYKNKKFAYLNQEAKDILKVDLNKDKGLEITTKISQMASDAAKFMRPTKKLFWGDNRSLVVASTPNLEKNNSILTVSNPSISDLIKDKLGHLKDHSKWMYALGLNTTEEGSHVENLIPADTPMLLSSKITFFECAMTSKNMFLELTSKEDVLAFAYVAHKISKRAVFEEVEGGDNSDELAAKVFGTNPLLGDERKRGLLETLNQRGTLLVHDVHKLRLELQKKFLECLLTGKFRAVQSDTRVVSDVLMIFSCNQNLLDLVNRGLFLKDLYLELNKYSVWLPSLTTLPEAEFMALVDGLHEQVVYSKIYQNLLELNMGDRGRLLSSACVSLYELKNRIKNIVVKKTQKKVITGEVVDPAYGVTDLDLVEAARLGKHALRDPKMLKMLMLKFKGCQSKVAEFLNVNRSSVSRRCDQYGIAERPLE